MSRQVRVAIAAIAVMASSVAVAIAGGPEGQPKGKYTGLSDDDEAVTVKVGEAHGDKIVKSFKVDQGAECGKTKINSKNNKKMPVTVDGDGNFKIVVKEKIGGQKIETFSVSGGFAATGVIQGGYSQVACDGGTDSFVVFAGAV